MKKELVRPITKYCQYNFSSKVGEEPSATRYFNSINRPPQKHISLRKQTQMEQWKGAFRVFLLLITLVILSLVTYACSIKPNQNWFTALGSGIQEPSQKISYLVSAPNATPTATPFQPIDPTPTYLPSKSKTNVPENKKNENNNPNDLVPTLSTSSDQINILLLGSDQRPFDGGFRTDTIILLILKPSQGTASMVSFPRDLYVNIPYHGENRINTAMVVGGFPLLNDTLEINFGVRAQHYVMVNFWAFVQTIDSLGGIDVHVSTPLTDHREGYGQFTIPAGTVHMDGDTALWYARSRYSSSDFARTRRQQEVIRAIFERLLSLNAIERAPEIYDIYSKNVTTDLSLGDITPLIPLAIKLTDPSRMQNYLIDPSYVTPWTTPGGAQVLLPNRYAIQGLLRQAIGAP